MFVETSLSPTDELVVFATSAKPPEQASEAARTALLHAVEVAMGAANRPDTAIAFETVNVWQTKPFATVFGRSQRLGPQWAAFVNAVAAGCAVVPAALATAEYASASGDALLEAIAIGREVEARLQRSAGVTHEGRGWDIRGTLGRLAAVVAAARVLRADGTAMRNALSIAATQAAGLRSASGTMTQSFIAGKAAADAVESALLARGGFTGPAQPLEGRRGFATLMAGSLDFASLVADLGTVWIAPLPERAGGSDRHADAANFVASILGREG